MVAPNLPTAFVGDAGVALTIFHLLVNGIYATAMGGACRFDVLAYDPADGIPLRFEVKTIGYTPKYGIYPFGIRAHQLRGSDYVALVQLPKPGILILSMAAVLASYARSDLEGSCITLLADDFLEPGSPFKLNETPTFLAPAVTRRTLLTPKTPSEAAQRDLES